jgi:hypothetical protein
LRIATDLAGDLARLAGPRSGLRERMRRSRLMDARRLIRERESADVGIRVNGLAENDPITGSNRSG